MFVYFYGHLTGDVQLQLLALPHAVTAPHRDVYTYEIFHFMLFRMVYDSVLGTGRYFYPLIFWSVTLQRADRVLKSRSSSFKLV